MPGALRWSLWVRYCCYLHFTDGGNETELMTPGGWDEVSVLEVWSVRHHALLALSLPAVYVLPCLSLTPAVDPQATSVPLIHPVFLQVRVQSFFHLNTLI